MKLKDSLNVVVPTLNLEQCKAIILIFAELYDIQQETIDLLKRSQISLIRTSDPLDDNLGPTPLQLG